MKVNRKFHIAGMVIGAALLLSPLLGFSFAASHAWAFLNVARMSDPAVTSSTNSIVLCTTFAGFAGLLLLALSLASLLREGHSAMHAPHPRNA